MFKQIGTIIMTLITVVTLTACGAKKTVDDNVIDITVTPVTKEQEEINVTITPEAKQVVLDEGDDVVEEIVEAEVVSNKPDIKLIRLPIPWEKTDYFGDGMIGFQDPDTDLWGYCDYNGNIVLDAQYTSINAFINGYALVRTDDESKYIDKAGNAIYSGSNLDILIPFTEAKEYAYILDGSSNLFIDKSGNIFDGNTPEMKEQYLYIYDEEITREVLATRFNTYTDPLIFDRTEKYGLHDYNGEEELASSVIKDKKLNDVLHGYELLELFPELTGIGLSDDYIAVSQVDMINSRAIDYDITTGLIDYDKHIIIEPGLYAYIIPLDKEHIIVATYDKKYGLVNSKGEFLIELSNKKIAPMLTEPDKNKSFSEGLLYFEPIGDRSVSEFLYDYKVVNETGSNYILIIDKGDNASCEIYDIDQNMIIGKMPKYSDSHQAQITYLFQDFSLYTQPFECYDYEGNGFSTGVLPEIGFNIDKVYQEGDRTYLILEGYNETRYIEVVQ